MIYVEDAFQIVGAKSGEDYTYKDLVQIALVTADKPNTI
jgi:polyhydroxyalkanoate synthesis regulator protein